MATIYRKYRPQVFDEVFGQEHIKETLTKALKLDRVAHAYLFTGARGVGKTTVARLLAKAVNCLDENVKPCGKCANCKAIAENRFIDLIEIDAASNRGIDEIRELRDKIQFSPSIGKKRVYIIDEVHMLTREAFNALLKTLEEPPEHTIFIFATTEVHKVPITVLSRCQRFDFRLADENLIKESLKKIAKTEGFKVEDKIVELLARSSGGSFRDAQSLLDQLSSHLVEGNLSYEQALQILNLSSVQEIEDFIAVLESNQPKEAIDFIARLQDKGVSFPDFLTQLVIELRRRLIEKIKSDQDSSWENQALNKLVKAEAQMKFAPIESLPLELVVYEMCFAGKNVELSAHRLVPRSFSAVGSLGEGGRIENTGEKGQNKESGIKNEAGGSKQTVVGDNSVIASPFDKLRVNSAKQSDILVTLSTVEGSALIATSPTIGLGSTPKPRNDEIENKPKPKPKLEAKVEDPLTDSEDTPALEIIPITQDIKHAVVMEVSQKNKTLGTLLTDLSWGGDSTEVILSAQYSFHKNKILDKKNLLLLENCLETVLQCKSKVTCEIKKEEDLANEIESVFGEE